MVWRRRGTRTSGRDITRLTIDTSAAPHAAAKRPRIDTATIKHARADASIF